MNQKLFILLLLLPYLISLSSKLFCEGNEPNGVISNIVFFKVEAFHPFIADTQSENIFFQTLFCEGNKSNGVDSNICFDKGRLFILLLLLPYLISLSSKLFCVGKKK
jgi:hypothetical protein